MEHRTALEQSDLAAWVVDARQRTLDLIADLDDRQIVGAKMDTVNPLIWEVGHAAWFHEKWILRHVLGRPPMHPEVDELYDSITIPHEVRWDLPVFDRPKILGYLREVRDRVVGALEKAGNSPRDDLVYFVKLSVFHEDMHTEAFTYTRQTLGYPAPQFLDPGGSRSSADGAGICPLPDSCDVMVCGGKFPLGAVRDGGFVFDNEQWALPVDVAPFAVSRTAVTQQQFADFVLDDGYQREDLWTTDGWRWRTAARVVGPVYWHRDGGDWLRRDFDRLVPLEPRRPMQHANWYEADAYCRWAGRRLPTEAEWEFAASHAGPPGGPADKLRFPWGNDAPSDNCAHMDWRGMATVDVDALPGGDSGCGCRQLIGNVWEWTASDFQPYPGFSPGPYREYSQPCFGSRKVLRGGCWATRSRLIRNTWRNYYTPDRRDVWAGFRTCALEP